MIAIPLLAAALLLGGTVAMVVRARNLRAQRDREWAALVARTTWTLQGVYVCATSGAPDGLAVEERLREVVGWWAARFDLVDIRKALDGCVLEFVPGPLIDDGRPMWGVTIGKHMRVLVGDRALYNVAHEASHVIASALLGLGDEDAAHAFFVKEQLPWS